MGASLQIYHRLPPWARTVAASARGYYLSRWRYDAQTEKLVEEALERDQWNEKQWKEWQEDRLSLILRRAATKVPFYREQWARRRREGDQSSWEYLENWEILQKQTLRDRKFEFVADDCNRSKMFRDNTSGTTGTSLDIWSTAATVKHWYALFEARCRRWYGVSKDDRWAILGGQLVTPFNQENPPFWVWNAGLKQLYMSAYHLAPEQISHYLDALVKYRIKYVIGYSSAIYYLAQQALKTNYSDLKLEVAITNAEPLYPYQREAISAAFGCPVRETYGMAEIAAAASDCEQGSLHVWQDTGIIETDPKTIDENGFGDLICTGLVNPDMPLIKYRVGDYGRLSNRKCICGKESPLLDGVDGRSDDVLYSLDGRPCSHLHLVLGGNLPIFEAQIIQHSFDSVEVLYIPENGFSEETAATLIEKIHSRMGDVTVNLKKVTEIPRTARGKFRAVICRLTEREKDELRSRVERGDQQRDKKNEL